MSILFDVRYNLRQAAVTAGVPWEVAQHLAESWPVPLTKESVKNQFVLIGVEEAEAEGYADLVGGFIEAEVTMNPAISTARHSGIIHWNGWPDIKVHLTLDLAALTGSNEATDKESPEIRDIHAWEELCKIIRAEFSVDAFTELLSGVGIELVRITTADGFDRKLINLFNHLETQGRVGIVAVARAVVRAKPGNEAAKKFAQKYGIE